jgi:hypothetical protein
MPLVLVLAGLLVSSNAFAERGDRVYGGVNYGPPTIANGMVKPTSARRQLNPIWVGARHARALDGRGPVDRPGVTFKTPHVTRAVTQVANKMFGGEKPNRTVVRKAMRKLYGRSGLRPTQIERLAGGKLKVYGARLLTDPRARTIPGSSKKGHAVYGALLLGTAVTPWDSNRSKRYVNVVLKSSRPAERAILKRLARDAEAQAVAIGQ